MKNKIRRAFDLTKLNVLHQILDDTPAPMKSAKPKKKRLSDRATQFIATAASLAIFVGAVFGGIAYYKDYFRGQGPSGNGGNALNSGTDYTHSTSGLLVPPETVPLNTVDYDWTAEGLEKRVLDIVLPDRQSMDSVVDIPVGLHRTDSEIVVDCHYGGIVYTFRFSPHNGALLRIEAADNGLDSVAETSLITESAAAWIALMDLDPGHYGITQYADYNVQLMDLLCTEDSTSMEDLASSTLKPDRVKLAYQVEIYHYKHQGTYFIDASTGEIQSKRIDDPVDKIPLEDAEKIVTKAVLAEREDCYIVSSQEVDNSYHIRVCCTDDPITADGALALICFEYYVNPESGDIIAMDKGLSKWDEDTALLVATAYGKANGCYPLSGQYIFLSGLPSFYEVAMTYDNGDNGIFYIQVYELYNSLTPPVDSDTAIFNAREVALEQYGYTVDDARILKISGNIGLFEIYYEVGGHGYRLYVDANGTVLNDYGVTDAVCPEMPAESIGWKSARDICLADCGRSMDGLIGFTWDFAEGCYWMELHFSDFSYDYRVDAMDGTLIFDTPVVDGMITYEQAQEIAVNHADCLEEALAGSLAEMSNRLDQSNGIFTVNFMNDDVLWIIEIDAYTGEVTSASSDTLSPPDGNIGEDLATQVAADHAGCLDDYEAGTLADVAVKFDEGGGVYWVYFYHDGLYWEIEVGAFNPRVISANSTTVFISEDEATLAAMENAGCMEDYLAGAVEELSCKLIKEPHFDRERYLYYVYFRLGDHYYAQVLDAQSGESQWSTSWFIGSTPPRSDFTGYGQTNSYPLGTEAGRSIILTVAAKPGVRHYVMEDPGNGGGFSITGQESALESMKAMNILAEQVGLETFTSGSVAMYGCFSDGYAFYCVVIPMDGYSHVALMDALTGEIFYQDTIS